MQYDARQFQFLGEDSVPDSREPAYVSIQQLQNRIWGTEIRHYRERDVDNSSVESRKHQYYRNFLSRLKHPWDQRSIYSVAAASGKRGKADIIEGYIPFIPVSTQSYLATLSVQSRADKYIQYLKYFICAVKPFASDPVYSHPPGVFSWSYNARFLDKVYPVWTADRFKEILVTESLDTAFSLLDATTVDDKKIKDSVYTYVLNRIVSVKSLLNQGFEKVYVRLPNKTSVYAAIISDDMTRKLKAACDDAAVIIRQNIDKLAVSVMRPEETKAISGIVAPNAILASRIAIAPPEVISPIKSIIYNSEKDAEIPKQKNNSAKIIAGLTVAGLLIAANRG